MAEDHGTTRGPVTLDELLRNRRRSVGLTQSELAQRAGIGVRTVRDLERGRATRPQRTTVELLASALGLTGEDRLQFLSTARGPAAVRAADEQPVRASSLGLPAPVELVGRDQDVAELSGILGAPDGAAPPVVSLVGLAGVGKTGLALAVAARIADRHPGGIAGIVITEGSSANDVLSAVAMVFGVARSDDLPVRLAEGPTLLLVDAVERQPAPVAEAVHWLTVRAPRLRVLATGRHPVGLPGERVWPVTPLEVPPADARPDLAVAAHYPAVELFLRRLRQVRPEPPRPDELPALVGLVHRLGGLPLAIELAAARGRILDLNEMLLRYGDRVLDLSSPSTTRQAVAVTLRDAVAASYRLLEPDERAALRRLAVFRNRWSVELAEAMLDGPEPIGAGGPARIEADVEAGPPPADPVSLLDRLLALGLLSARGTGEFRFRLLDVVRDFATERAAADGELTQIRRRHAVVLANLANRVAPELVGANLIRAVGTLDEVTPDLWAALAHAAIDDPHTALRLAAALPRWWRFRGRDRSGRQWLRRLLDDPRTADADPVLRAWAQIGIAQLAQEHGEGPRELTTVQEALWQFQQAGDVAGELVARSVLCGLYTAVGGHGEARRHGEAVLALAGRTGRTRDMAVAQNNLTWHEIRVGDLAAARRRLAAVDRLAAQCGEERLRVLARANLAEVARLDGRYGEAAQHGRRVARVLDDLGDPGHRRRVLGTVGLALAQDGRVTEAEAVLVELRGTLPPVEPSGGIGDGPMISAGSGPMREDGTIALLEGHLALRRGDREWAAEWFAAAERASTHARDARDVVEALVGLVVSTDDPDARAAQRVRLDEACRDAAISLLPQERALLDSVGSIPAPRPSLD
ncbi:helix-turn-helix domain-containing protein [Plantactinospora sp. KBS50]|uniref:ATP-binding protein n=1 Tax=Plantactinospora sp. KBS50 TaxID=2024580 RepID=UPI000BAAE3AD|nr:helix-turn-helix domain-containing protein [Plantactinospora sp. KBS50]ASW52972.1 XRE family transcriptional regulator [Plantactinospora sp. KBS50]